MLFPIVGGTTIRNLTFLEGLSQDNGGAIRLTGDSPVTIEGNTFLGNEAQDSGGAISIDSTDGPVETLARGDATPVFLRGNTFGSSEEGDANFADDEGGAVYINEPFRPVVVDEGNRFLRTAADSEGGGLSIFQNGCDDDKQRGGEAGPQLTQSGNLFQDNAIDGASGAAGGGEYIEVFTTQSTNDRFVGNVIEGFNQADGGGLAYFGFAAQPLAARNLVAAGNEASSFGQTPPSRGVAEQGAGGGLFLVGTEHRSSGSRTRRSRATPPRGDPGPPAGRCGAPSWPRAARC